MLKLSGEVLVGKQDYGIDPDKVISIAYDITQVHKKGKEICIVVGGGNIFRGISGAAQGIDRVIADGMGMLATVINALALQNAIEKNVKEILLNYNLYKEKAIRGRNHIIETFNWDKITSEYEKLIYKTIRSFKDANL